MRVCVCVCVCVVKNYSSLFLLLKIVTFALWYLIFFRETCQQIMYLVNARPNISLLVKIIILIYTWDSKKKKKVEWYKTSGLMKQRYVPIHTHTRRIHRRNKWLISQSGECYCSYWTNIIVTNNGTTTTARRIGTKQKQKLPV